MPDDFIKNHHGINISYPTSDPGKNAQKFAQDFNKAKEKIRQELIASDKSGDKTVVYTAMTQFKKINE